MSVPFAHKIKLTHLHWLLLCSGVYLKYRSKAPWELFTKKRLHSPGAKILMNPDAFFLKSFHVMITLQVQGTLKYSTQGSKLFNYLTLKLQPPHLRNKHSYHFL